jgi:hypothetical protein
MWSCAQRLEKLGKPANLLTINIPKKEGEGEMGRGKCLVGYKTQILGGMVYGEAFCELRPCCSQFKVWFNDARARKGFDDSLHRSVNGINLTASGGDIYVALRLAEGDGLFMEDKMRFCPFCGAEIEVKRTRTVELRERLKQVHDGYDEIPVE